MPSRILECNCRSENQNKLYGENKRVFNLTAISGDKTWRCSVCLREINTGGSEDNKKTSSKESKNQTFEKSKAKNKK